MKFLLMMMVVVGMVGLGQAKVLWTVNVRSSAPTNEIYRCDYLGFWDGSGHFNCSIIEPKRQDYVYRIMISYPKKDVFIFPRAPSLPIPKELR